MSDGPVLTTQIAERLKNEDVTSDLSSFNAVEAAALAVLTSHCFELNLEGVGSKNSAELKTPANTVISTRRAKKLRRPLNAGDSCTSEI